MSRGRSFCRATGFTFMILTVIFSSTAVSLTLPGIWKTYTSKKEVRDVVVKNGVVWAATSGGMFSFTVTDSSFQEFTTSEGLRTNDLSSITADPMGTVWAGASNGLIHAYNPVSRQWKYVTDIARSAAPQKKINVLVGFGDTLYIGSEIGLHSFLISSDQFGIDAPNFGSGLQISGNVTSITLFGDSIWVGTLNGIAAAPRSHPNLRDPGSWRVWQSGLPSNTVSSLTVFRGVLYAATDLGLTRYNGSSWTGVPGTNGRSILHTVVYNDSLYCITSSELFSLDTAENVSPPLALFSSLSSLAVENSRIVIGSLNDGIYIKGDTTWQSRVPKGPPTNHFNHVAIDDEGMLWVGTGTNPGDGFLSFDGKEWIQYSFQQYPILGTNAYYKVNVGKDNVKWVSSFGRGVVLVDAEGTIQKVFNTSNGLPYTACSGCAPPFVVVAGVVTDRDGKAWICVRTANGDSTFVVVSQDTIVSYVVGPPPGPAPIFIDPVMDDFGTIWLANWKRTDGNAVGLYFYNDRGFPGGGNTRWGRVTTDNGLAGNQVYAVAVDHSDQVWVGTDKGVTIIINPYSLQPPMAQYYPLRDQQINALAVDALNNKWVATNQGIFVLSSDGTSILAEYSVENTEGRLVDNVIQSIAIDGKTGTVYFGSEKGLSTLSTSAVTPARSFDELSIAPNPFYLPSTTMLVVDGLVKNSSLKILSIDGRLIKDVKTPGGKVGYWDGTDTKGNYVSSGVYIITAYSENGSQVATAKVAVLRR